ncbi:Uncharacterised protein [uncultured archaeon]|nr:Uncharacterised protein [uncultured archaeon]
MNIIRLTAKYDGIDVLKREKIVVEKVNKVTYCKHCGHKNNVDEIQIEKLLWQCASCNRKNKYDLSKERIETFYYINTKKLSIAIDKKIKSSDLILTNIDGDYFIYYANKKIPLIVADSLENTSTLIDILKHSSLILYFLDETKAALADIYSTPKFLKITDFLNMDEGTLINKVHEISLKFDEAEVFKIKSKINVFCKDSKNWKEFEEEITKLFDELKFNEKGICDMLLFFKRNQNNPTGTKFVHVGGNFPSDISSIQLFEYMNKMLEVMKNKAYDAKQLSQKLSKTVVDEKCRTNKGKRLVFMTNKSAASGAWEEIIKAKEQASDWFHFIIDLDLLTILLYFVGYEGYFNEPSNVVKSLEMKL